MAEENVKTEGTTPPASGAGDVTPTMSADEIDKRFKEFETTITANLEKKYKAQISGLDSVVTKLKKDNEDLKVKGLSNEEKAAELIRIKDEESKARELELKNRETALWKLENVSSLKLPEGITPAELTEFIHGNTAEEVKESTNRIYALIAKIQAAGAAKVIEGVDNTPGKANGKQTLDNLEALKAKLDEAKKTGNAILAGQLLDKIAELSKIKK